MSSVLGLFIKEQMIMIDPCFGERYHYTNVLPMRCDISDASETSPNNVRSKEYIFSAYCQYM